MSRLGKITRRGFLVTGVAVAGGVAFGVYKARQVPPNPLHPAAGASLNPWLILNAEGATVIVPRAEMGQGVTTTLAALVAEELDMAWDQVSVLHGPPAQAYFNGAIIEAGLPYAAYAMTEGQRRWGERLAVVPKVFSLQITGGSSSTSDAFEKMRLAGATAREALKAVAATRLKLAVADLTTGDGRVIAPDGRSVAYADLAVEAATVAVGEVALRPASDWRLLGKSLPRKDIPAKSTGTAEFAIDVRLPGMKFASLRMTPRLGGTMMAYNAAPAMAVEGVERVIDLGTGLAVVASNTWSAMQGAEALAPDWGPAPYPADSAGQMAKIAEAFLTRRNSRLRDDGDIEAALAGDGAIEADYSVPFLAHATMEPMTATAWVKTDGTMELWSGNQAPLVTRDRAADAAGIAAEKVTVHTTLMGGAFGRRGETDFSVLAARVAAALKGTPVQLTWSREEDTRHDFYRPAAMARFQGRVADGKAVALKARIAAPSVGRQAGRRLAGFAPPGPDKGMVEGLFDQPYAIPNYRVDGHIADLDVPIGFWRSVGASHNGFFTESFIDEMAHAAGADPLEFRLDLIRPLHEPSARLLEAVREMSGWTGKTPEGVGRGVAFVHSFGTPVAEVVEVRQTEAGIRIAEAWVACDPGIALDPRNIEAQMISGLIFGLSAAVTGEITFAGGEVEQGNFPDMDPLRMHTAPKVSVHVQELNGHLSGVGEPGTPPAAPALANALFDLTGRRARVLPLNRTFDFVT